MNEKTGRQSRAIAVALQPRTDAGTFAPGDERRQLTERQATFVRLYAESGGDGTASAIGAGYAESGASVEACRLLRLPWIAAELERERSRLLGELEVKSLKVVRGILDEVNPLAASWSTKLKAAEIVLKIRAGERAQTDKAQSDKEPSDMTIAELEAHIRDRENALQRVNQPSPRVGSAQGSESQSS